MSEAQAEPTLPTIMGFRISQIGRIPRLENFNPTNRPNATRWNAMLEQIRESGGMTSSTTSQGRNHPCQTQDLRCDHQNQVGNYVNTQCQVGGLTKYTRGKYNGNNESTSLSHVSVHASCYSSPTIGLALASCHDYSFRSGNTVQMDPAATATIAVMVQPPVMTFICGRCGKEETAVDSVELGLRFASYPPACSRTDGACRTARGEGGFTRR